MTSKFLTFFQCLGDIFSIPWIKNPRKTYVPLVLLVVIQLSLETYFIPVLLAYNFNEGDGDNFISVILIRHVEEDLFISDQCSNFAPQGNTR